MLGSADNNNNNINNNNNNNNNFNISLIYWGVKLIKIHKGVCDLGSSVWLAQSITCRVFHFTITRK